MLKHLFYTVVMKIYFYAAPIFSLKYKDALLLLMQPIKGTYKATETTL